MEITDINALAKAFEANHLATKSAIEELHNHVDQIEARMNRPGGGAGNRVIGDLKAEYSAIGSFVRSGDDSDIRALSVSDDTAAGYFVHPQLSDTMTKRIFDQSPIRGLVRVVQIGDGGGFQEPIDLSDVGAEWVGEEEARPETAAPNVGMLNIPLDEVYALQVVTQRLLDDAVINIGEWVIEKISDKFARTDGKAFTVGTGHKQPKGFLTYPTSEAKDSVRAKGAVQHIWSGGVSAITADALRNTFWALRSDHRQNATWVMSSAVANSIDRLKSGDGEAARRGASLAEGNDPMTRYWALLVAAKVACTSVLSAMVNRSGL